MSNPPVKAYAETSALYAILTGHDEKAEKIVADFLNEELGLFLQRILTLHKIVVTEMSGRAPTRSSRNGH